MKFFRTLFIIYVLSSFTYFSTVRANPLVGIIPYLYSQSLAALSYPATTAMVGLSLGAVAANYGSAAGSTISNAASGLVISLKAGSKAVVTALQDITSSNPKMNINTTLATASTSNVVSVNTSSGFVSGFDYVRIPDTIPAYVGGPYTITLTCTPTGLTSNGYPTCKYPSNYPITFYSFADLQAKLAECPPDVCIYKRGASDYASFYKYGSSISSPSQSFLKGISCLDLNTGTTPCASGSIRGFRTYYAVESSGSEAYLVFSLQDIYNTWEIRTNSGPVACDSGYVYDSTSKLCKISDYLSYQHTVADGSCSVSASGPRPNDPDCSFLLRSSIMTKSGSNNYSFLTPTSTVTVTPSSSSTTVSTVSKDSVSGSTVRTDLTYSSTSGTVSNYSSNNYGTSSSVPYYPGDTGSSSLPTGGTSVSASGVACGTSESPCISTLADGTTVTLAPGSVVSLDYSGIDPTLPDPLLSNTTPPVTPSLFDPIRDKFSSLLNLTPPDHESSCLALSFSVFGHSFSDDRYCQVLEDNKSWIQPLILLSYTFNAILIFLSA